MGKRGFSRDFVRKQEAASAYKKALADAAASLQKVFRSSPAGTVIDVGTAHDALQYHQPETPSHKEPSRRPASAMSCLSLSFGGYSRSFEERYERSYAKFFFSRNPHSGLVPKTKWEKQNQAGTALSPLWDRDHPLFSREENVQERKRFVRSKGSVNDEDIELFASRQEEYQSRKEDQIRQQTQADMEKFASQRRVSAHTIREFLDRRGPKGAELHRKEVVAKAEDKMLANLSFTPGGEPKKWDPSGEEYYDFLERQQAAMRKRMILADRPYGSYAPVPSYVAGDDDDEDED